MGDIVLAGSTSGTTTLTPTAVSGTTTLTLPATTDTLVGKTTTDKLTNKTLTSPTITGATITVASTAAPTFSAYTVGTGATIGTSATKVTYNTEEWDTNNNFASSRFTPTVAGYYQINAQLQPNDSYTGGFIAIYKNGSSYKNGTYPNNATILFGGFTVSSIVYCNGTTDYIEIYGAFATTAQVTGTGINFTWFNGCFLRSA